MAQSSLPLDPASWSGEAPGETEITAVPSNPDPAATAASESSALISAGPATVESTPERTNDAPLTDAELRERLALNSPLLVEQLFTLTLRQLDLETARQLRIDGKATSLLSATALTLTVAIGFGLPLITDAARLHSLAAMPVRQNFIALFLIGAFLSGLAATLCALFALRVQSASYSGVNEHTLFNAERLRLSDASIDKESQQRVGLTDYRRHMIPHVWQIVTQHDQTDTKKAAWVQKGQAFFGGFVVCLLFLLLSLLATVAR